MSLKIILANLALVSAVSGGTYSLAMKNIEDQRTQSELAIRKSEASIKDTSHEIQRLRQEIKELRQSTATPSIKPATLETPALGSKSSPPSVTNYPPESPIHGEESGVDQAPPLSKDHVQKLVETVIKERESEERAINRTRMERRNEENFNKMMEALGTKLNLSPTQLNEIREIHKSSQEAFASVREELRRQWEGTSSEYPQPDRGAIREKFSAITQETNTKIERVIGQGNMESYTKISEEYSMPRQGRWGRDGQWRNQESPPSEGR